MKYIYYIIIVIIGLLTSFFIWSYIQRSKFVYNTESTFLSPEDGVVYHEQAKEVYGILALIGLMVTGITLYALIKNLNENSRTSTVIVINSGNKRMDVIDIDYDRTGI